MTIYYTYYRVNNRECVKVRKALFFIVLLGVLSLSGCQNHTEQYDEVNEYNENVTSTVEEFNATEKVAKELAEDVANFVTYNSISDELYEKIELEKNVDKDSAENDEEYKLRNASQIIDDFEDTVVYKAYEDFVSAKLDDTSRNIYAYGNPYIWDSGYYSSVSSQYIEQFMVVHAEDSTERVIVQAYWKNGKLVRVVLSE